MLKDTRARRQALEALRDAAIVHYAGGYKPWEYDCKPGFNEKYYGYLHLSVFKDAVMPQPGKNKSHSWSHEAARLRWAAFWNKVLP